MALRGTVLCLCLIFALAFADKGCDESQCNGPIKYYEDVNCKPVYAKPGDCCPVKYDCSHLETRSADKCYVNGKEFSIGQVMEKEDRVRPCDVNCRCNNRPDNTAGFDCAVVDCYFLRPHSGCYLKKRDPKDCCASAEVCPKEGEEIFSCKVDGQTYLEGKLFYPKSKPGFECTCLEGFNGEFVEPFCRKKSCGTEVAHSIDIYNKCVPTYYYSNTAVTSCDFYFECPSDSDTVIKAPAKSSEEDISISDNKSSDMTCTFGKLTMDLGDTVSRPIDYGCFKCVCEVPPTPTCRRYKKEDCDKI